MKRLITSIFIFTILFSYSIIAQQLMTFNRKNLTYPAEKIIKPMRTPLPAGTYSIGTPGNFPTIDSAFKKLSTDGIAGSVILELIDTLYTAPSTVYGFYLKGPISGATKDDRITIRPATNKKVIIRGSGESVLRFWNVNYLTLDGVSLNGNTTLKVHALKNTQFYHNDAVIFLSNSDHNIIQNITASSDDYTRSYASIGFFLYEMTDSAPDSNLIQNNFVPQGGWGSIYVSALLPDYSMRKKAIGNIISGNLIGSETDSLNTSGIQIEGCENTIVENNSIQNLRLILKDKQATVGIVGFRCFNCIIRNNLIFNFDDNDSQMGTCAIILSGAGNALGNNNIVCNNMVYDIRNSSKNPQSVASGIYLRYQNNPKIYYNSVYLYGKGLSPSGSAAFYIGVQCTNVEAKNNIFVNTRDESSHCASSIYSSTADFISDNNDLYYEPNQYNCLIKIDNTKYNTLNDWQVIGNDLNSISEMPNFKIPHLHIDESIPTKLESNGTPIPETELDFDGEARDSISTDIGADEFDGTPLVDMDEEVRQPLRFTLNQNYPNPFNPTTKIGFRIANLGFVSLKVFDLLGREVATLVDEEKSAGTYEVTWNASNLPSGVYFYQLKVDSYTATKKLLLLK